MAWHTKGGPVTRTSVPYEDLLGIPHVSGSLELSSGALDCSGIVAEVIRRVLGEEARAAFLGQLAGRGSDWIEVPQAEARLGDVVLSGGGDGPHVSAVVSTGPDYVLSSAYGLGSFATRLRSVVNLVCVYRYPGPKI
tara:strand:- start:1449 stop:1859 length:411 start_codon:yes stop_codon:yes gene_type:complete